MTASLEIEPIGVIHTAFDEKFGIPRQPGLARSVEASIELYPPYASDEAVRGLDQCSHLWLLFWFSATADQGWKPLVRPPRLGGNRKLGVFASRSPFRPNPIGLSPVELRCIRREGGKLWIDVIGADLLNGTPILDIKPYLPYSDSLPEARFDLAEKIEMLDLPILGSEQASARAAELERDLAQPVTQQVEEVLRCDPRPAYQQDPERIYGISLHQHNIRFRIGADVIEVVSLDTSPA